MEQPLIAQGRIHSAYLAPNRADWGLDTVDIGIRGASA